LIDFPVVSHASLMSRNEIRLQFDIENDITESFIKASIEKGWRLRAIAPEQYSMDEIFAQLSKNAINNRD
jgi:ornithine carbamoyltransferase